MAEISLIDVHFLCEITVISVLSENRVFTLSFAVFKVKG